MQNARMAEKITLKVNGNKYTLEIDPDTPLLYALRNNLLLNGPKYGCGMAHCGSCMVLLNGKALPSCNIPCSTATRLTVTTLEGIGGPENLHPLQKAFIDEQSAQCGYCMNGMIMAAKALLDQNKDPSDEEIRMALHRVLCRCGSHSRILQAVKVAAKNCER